MKRETNMEHYRGEIEKMLALEDEGEGFAVVHGKPRLCFDTLKCSECDLDSRYGECNTSFIKWLMSEYKPEPVLTQKEKGFLDCIGEGWIARDEEGLICWFEEKPTKGDDEWNVDSFEECYAYLNKDTFPFIIWEDEEPWSVEELRKLKVKE